MHRRALLGLPLALPLLGRAGRAREIRGERDDRYPVARALGGASERGGYARAIEPRAFAFPADHGPHPDYRTEWWYFTGNLAGPGMRRWGYQLTFFRIALAPGVPVSPSAWRTHQLYMAHFAVSDVGGRRFHAFERFARGALGLAGAVPGTLRVWSGPWRAEATDGPGLPVRLTAAAGPVAIDLHVRPGKPFVLQGEDGLSRKSAAPGNASYYYSGTRLPTAGRIRARNASFEVRGTSWLDREWSTSALGEDQSGWDWFALQLADGRELMYYRLRRRDGGVDPHSAGTLVAADGAVTRLAAGDVRVEITDHWRSPATGTRYPAGWVLHVAGLQLRVTPLLADQELDLTVRYWEGAVRVRGRDSSGFGYVELAGYD